MGGREQDLIASGAEERAGGLAVAGRDALAVAGLEVEGVDLVERIRRLALALEHHALAVGREIAFARPLPLNRQAPHARQKLALPGRRLSRDRGHHRKNCQKGDSPLYCKN